MQQWFPHNQRRTRDGRPCWDALIRLKHDRTSSQSVMDFQDSRQRRSNLPKLITRDGAEAFDETLLCHGAHLEGIRGGRLYPVSANGAALIRSLGQRPRKIVTSQSAALKARLISEPVGSIITTMPQSLSRVIIHVIFSTKNREPWLDSTIRPRMHAYLATICRDLDGEALRVGGVADHVHILTTLPRTLSQAQMIEGIKKPSSKWIKALEVRYRGFFWQRGYGAFSVSPSQLDAVLQYVETQEEHHRTLTFQEEYRELLRRHGMEFDERYVWD